jgi:hypothetical protein
MKPISWILCLCIFTACSAPSSGRKTKHAETNSGGNASTVFVFENETLKQTVELGTFTENEIAFKLTSENKVKKQRAAIEEVARSAGGDPETDEDADGNAYPAVEYIYRKSCWLTFRIDWDTKTRMRINEADCSVHGPDCPFASAGLLMKR